MISDKGVTLSNQAEADVEFCLIQQQLPKVKPMILRLDGIWFNSEQEYNKQNAPIIYSYNNADAVVFQSKFNKVLIEAWFGKHKNSHVIHNASDEKLINAANKQFWNSKLGIDTEVWCCASNWRPHKRLRENIRYFLEFAPKNATLAIAGALHMDEAKQIMRIDKRIVLVGDLDYMSLLSLYKRCSTFIHLAYLDHCPNVVVDAQASGCKVICSSSGGTQEVVSNGTIVLEDEWDMKPCKLYKPPPMDFTRTIPAKDSSGDMSNNLDTFDVCTNKYFEIMKGLL